VTRADRIAGCLYGAAIGDALGSAFEWVDAAAIERAVGEPFVWDYRPALVGSLLYPRKPGRPTDDTAMALSVASVVAAGGPFAAETFASRFIEDLERDHGRYAEMFWRGGPGGATTRALSRLRRGADPATCGHPNDGGNGAAMRVHPVGFLPDRHEVLAVAALQARVTHGHPGAIAAAQAAAVLVYDALAGGAPSANVPPGVTEETFSDAWRRAHAGVVRGESLPPHLRNVAMSGWETVAGAHAIALAYEGDPNRAIAAAVASGGDTDTIGCIVGAIVGARAGFGALRGDWIAGLRDDGRVGAVVTELTSAAAPSIPTNEKREE
jgi:ADP-ribosylglycohydrolase